MWEDHQKNIDIFLISDPVKSEAKRFLKVHKEKIKYLQHERLVHLLVMLTVGIASLLTVLTSLIIQNATLLVPGVMLASLFFGYLVYYRKLENITQRWYGYNAKISERI
jgi:hypothetical protein